MRLADPAPDGPRTLTTRAERARRVLLLLEPHVAPLASLVREFRKERGLTREIPHFDPLDGGVEAGVLFVFEAPGKKAAESGFVSMDNDDERAATLHSMCTSVGLPRKATVFWSLVPWVATNKGGTARIPTPLEIAQAKPYLERVIALLPRLEAIVLFGLNAQREKTWIASLRPGVTILHAPHASPDVLNREPENLERLETAVRAAAELLSREKAVGSS